MVLTGAFRQTQLSVNLKETAFTVMFDFSEALTYDRGGRLWSHFNAGHTYRRGLSGQVMDKWQEHGVRQRRWLNPDEAARLIDYGAARMRWLREQVAAGRVTWMGPPGKRAHTRTAEATVADLAPVRKGLGRHPRPAIGE